jgi:hypothetical protein
MCQDLRHVFLSGAGSRTMLAFPEFLSLETFLDSYLVPIE